MEKCLRNEEVILLQIEFNLAFIHSRPLPPKLWVRDNTIA